MLIKCFIVVFRASTFQISSNLQDAHEWFKSKFDGLQTELVQSKRTQAEIEKENTDTRHMLHKEKKRAEDTADRAKAMIRVSNIYESDNLNHAYNRYLFIYR